MAKRKAARTTGRKSSKGGTTRKRTAARKTAARKGAAKKAARASAKASARARGGSAKAARGASRKTAARKTVSKAVKAAPKRKAAARKAAPKAKAAVSRSRAAAPRSTTAAPRTAARGAAKVAPVRKAPALDRARRTIDDEDIVPTPPSSLDLDRSASAVRTGRRGLRDRYAEHTETSPAITGGDVDADWESAYSVGDEAPGGDNPTPDQDIVDDIGRAVGIEYQDNEELKGADKVAKRDKDRWELDPASAEDWEDR